MVRTNKTRIDYLAEFQAMIDEYNAGSINVEEFFGRLCLFAQKLNEEDKRGLAEGLTEEELAIFDLLTKPDIKLTAAEQTQVKAMAHDLLEKLKAGKLVLDWKKRQQTQAAVRLCIEEVLDQLPQTYSADQYQAKCDVVFQHVYDSYSDAERNAYSAA